FRFVHRETGLPSNTPFTGWFTQPSCRLGGAARMTPKSKENRPPRCVDGRTIQYLSVDAPSASADMSAWNDVTKSEIRRRGRASSRGTPIGREVRWKSSLKQGRIESFSECRRVSQKSALRDPHANLRGQTGGHECLGGSVGRGDLRPRGGSCSSQSERAARSRSSARVTYRNGFAARRDGWRSSRARRIESS